MPSDAVRKRTCTFKARSFALYLCYKPCRFVHARSFIFQTLDSSGIKKKKNADKDVLLKTAEQSCLMTIPITRSTVNIQAQCGVSSGRELFCGNKQKEDGGEYLAGTRRFKD